MTRRKFDASDAVASACAAIVAGKPSSGDLTRHLIKLELPPDQAAAMIAELAYVAARFIVKIAEPIDDRPS